MNSIQLLSWNCRGINSDISRRHLKEILRIKQCQVLCLQETKCDSWSPILKDSIWDLRLHDWITVDSIGLSGGLALSWDNSEIQVTDHGSHQHFIWIRGHHKSNVNLSFVCVNVYMPHKSSQRKLIWNQLSCLGLSASSSMFCVLGDFNCILNKLDRKNCQYRLSDSIELDSFLKDLDFWDVPLVNAEFTWFGPYSRCSRIDRALINHNWRSLGQWSLFSLGRKSSDHSVLLLSLGARDWGPKPFRPFNSWLSRKDLFEIIFKHWRGLHSQVGTYIENSNLSE